MGQAFGTSHPLEELDRVWPKVIYEPMDVQALYAEAVTRAHVNDPAFHQAAGSHVDEIKKA